MIFDVLGNPLAALALTLPRITGAFLMLPLLTQQSMPPLVRNSFLVSLSIIALPIALAGLPSGGLDVSAMAPIILKEIFLGTAIGFCFGIVFWAIGAAGGIIDGQIGMTMATQMDPIQGHQAALHANFLSQFAATLFMASGAFLIFLDLLLSSYAIWPVMSFYPKIDSSGIMLFSGQFSYLMTAALVLAAPAMVVLMVVDLSFGLVNRFAPSLNVFALTLPIKAWLATAIILLMLGVLVEYVFKHMRDNRDLMTLLNHVFT